LMQLAVPLINRVVPSRSVILMASTVCCAGAMVFTALAGKIVPFAIGIGAYGLFNGLRNPMLNAIIADKSKGEEEGQVMGINQSYTSIGQAAGPAIAGLATAISLRSPFYLAALLILAGLFVSVRVRRRESLK